MNNNEYRTSPLTTDEVLHEVLWSKIEEAKPEYRKAFEDWLAEVERGTAEKAYERALDDMNGEGYLNTEEHEMFTVWHNPYRQKDS